jgi:hypothetical protein
MQENFVKYCNVRFRFYKRNMKEMKLSTWDAEKLLKCLVLVVIIDRTYFGVLSWLTFAV